MLLRLSLLIIALTTIISACAAPAASPAGRTATGGDTSTTPARPAQPKRIVVGIRGTAQVLYNKLNIGNAGLGVNEVEKLVGAGLGIQDEAGKLYPSLAEAVPSLENGLWVLLPDGRMETTWKLRPTALWHDGQQVTTADLLFTATLAQDRELTVFRDRAFDAVERLEAIDERTFKVTWSRPYVEADSLLSFVSGGAGAGVTPLPRHLLEGPYQQDKVNFPQIPFWNTDYVGAGPFRLKEYARDSGMTIVANDKFYLGRPKVDEIELKFIPDGNTIIANILAGTVDLTFDPRSITFAQALQIKDQWTAGQLVFAKSVWVTMYPQFLNPTPAAVGDIRFRRAMLHAINRQDIVETMQSGVGGVAHHYIAPDWAEYKEVEPSMVKYDYDLRRAAQLIESVGYTKGGDGVYRDASGQRIQLEIRTTGVDINSKSSFIVAENWQRFGVPTDVAIVPPQRTNEREYRATFPGFELIRPTSTLTSFDSQRSSEVPTPETNWAGANRQRYRNGDLDALIDRYFVTIPVGDRMRVLGQIVNHTTDQLTNLGIVYDPPLRLVANKLLNIPAGLPHNAIEWDVKA